jgi:uncharacterized membrane protein YwzB
VFANAKRFLEEAVAIFENYNINTIFKKVHVAEAVINSICKTITLGTIVTTSKDGATVIKSFYQSLQNLELDKMREKGIVVDDRSDTFFRKSLDILRENLSGHADGSLASDEYLSISSDEDVSTEMVWPRTKAFTIEEVKCELINESKSKALSNIF